MASATYDAVVVGSGFGGSVMAYRLAQGGRKVCLLERGKAWPPGSFPRTPFQFSQALWDPSEGLHGLYDVWSFGRLGALVSSGLGGGSLIYANVLLRKPAAWFVEHGRTWPITYDQLEPHYETVSGMIPAGPYPEHYRDTRKTRAFWRAAAAHGLDPFHPPLAITFADPAQEPGRPFDHPGQNLHRAQRFACRLVGECDAGCNFGSKNTLDFTYLSEAARAGLEIRCRHEVKAFEQRDQVFHIQAVDHTDAEEGRKPDGQPRPVTLDAKRLILSAGALGTPYLLLRNRSAFPKLSRRLGTRFSGNGDFLAFAARAAEPLEPAVGPVITTAVRVPDYVDGGDGPGHVVQDGGYPAFLATIPTVVGLPRLVWAGRRIAARLGWGIATGRPDTNLSAEVAGLLGARRLASGSLPILGMGREPAQGRMHLRDGLLDIEWSFKRAKPYFEHVRSTVRTIADGLEAELADNVLWKVSRVVTVHPLGGCPVGANAEEGVVHPTDGHVHNYPGLHVADGSVLPGTVGVNPSLTIAAVANLFADAILDGKGAG